MDVKIEKISKADEDAVIEFLKNTFFKVSLHLHIFQTHFPTIKSALIVYSRMSH